jgi:hypothetical protein
MVLPSYRTRKVDVVVCRSEADMVEAKRRRAGGDFF